MNSLIERLIAVFGTPNSPNLKVFFREYARATDTCSAEVLERGGDILLKTSEYSRWPTIAECVKACSIAAQEINGLPKVPQHESRREKTTEEAQRILARLEGYREWVAKQLADDVKANAATGTAEKPREWKGRTYFGVTREDFEGRYSTVLNCRWHSPTLAEVIACQDAKKHEGTD